MEEAIPHETERQAFSKSFVQNREAKILNAKPPLRSRFLACIGGHELFSPEMWRSTLSELVATAGFLFTLTTAIIACLESQGTDPRLIIPIAVFIIAFLFLLVTVPLSGGHMNPILSFIAALRGVITLVRCACYVTAQCIGSILAYLVLHSVMSSSAADKYSLGGCTIGGHGPAGISPGIALLVEFSCTLVVLYVGVTVAFDKRMFQQFGVIVVCVVVAGSFAVAVFVSITVTGRTGYAGAGLNPVRCLGPALLKGGPLWDGHWVFWVGPFLACMVYYAFSMALPKQELARADEEHDILKLVRVSCQGASSPV